MKKKTAKFADYQTTRDSGFEEAGTLPYLELTTNPNNTWTNRNMGNFGCIDKGFQWIFCKIMMDSAT